MSGNRGKLPWHRRFSRSTVLVMIITIVAIGVTTMLVARTAIARRTIVVAVSVLPEERGSIDWILDAFAREFPAYEVRRVSVTEATIPERNRRAERPDVYILADHSAWRRLVGSEDIASVPVDLVERLEYARNIVEVFTKSAMSPGTDAGNAVFAIPFAWAPYGFFVNREALAAQKVTIPGSWDELIVAIPRLKSHPQPFAFAIPGENPRRIELSRWVFSFNGGPSGTGLIDSFLRDQIAHPASETLSENDTVLMLLDGRVAMVLAPATLRRFIPTEYAATIRFVPVPTYDGRPPAVAARIIAAGATRRGIRKPAVSHFLEFVTRRKTQEGFVASAGSRVPYNAVHRAASSPDATGILIATLGRTARLIVAE